jgi:hypothetical protein
MYSLQIPNPVGKLVEIDTHDTCESAVEFMLACWHEDDQPPAFARVASPEGQTAALLYPALTPGVVRVLRKGGAVTFHQVAPLEPITLD